jgi:IS30 family transposase
MERSPRFVAPGRLIDHRPGIVDDRLRIGDWEGDLIVGRLNRSAIATLVDRRSRFVKLVAIPAQRTAEAVRDVIVAALLELPANARRSLTWDQGSEMAGHHQISEVLDSGVFFAHPGKPWQRGTNENTNGLLRQYFPKGTDLSTHTSDDLRSVEDRLNHRPLQWRLILVLPAMAHRSGATLVPARGAEPRQSRRPTRGAGTRWSPSTAVA